MDIVHAAHNCDSLGGAGEGSPNAIITQSWWEYFRSIG